MFKSVRWCILWIIVTMILARCSTPAELGWHHYWRPPGRPIQVYDLAVSGEWLWIATSRDILRVNRHTLTSEQFSYISDSPDASLDNLTILLVDDEDRLWVGRWDGLMRYDDDSGWTTITTKPAYEFALDTEGNVWVFSRSRYGSGAFRFQGQEPPPGGNWEPERVTDTSQLNDCKVWPFVIMYSSWKGCNAVSNRALC